MEQLISKIEVEALARGILPQSLIRRSVGLKWATWADWKSGKSSPTLATVDRIHVWMEENPLKSDCELEEPERHSRERAAE